MKILKWTIVAFAISVSAATLLNAQKLPNKQEISLGAPANVKIDGKMNEWGGKLQAYNKATLIYYTMANDADNLYLVVNIEDPGVINKAISGAITLTVNPADKKSDEKCPAVSFPLLNFASGTAIRTNARLVRDGTNNTNLKSTNTDSLLRIANKRLSDGTKEIKLSDIEGITDTVTGTHTDKLKQFKLYPLFYIPGYYIPKENNLGIKAAASFEGDKNYTYELAMPLKYLKVQPGKKFSYNIRLNGPMYKTNKPTSGYAIKFRLGNGTAIMEDQDLVEATDFWAEYTLANKP